MTGKALLPIAFKIRTCDANKGTVGEESFNPATNAAYHFWNDLTSPTIKDDVALDDLQPDLIAQFLFVCSDGTEVIYKEQGRYCVEGQLVWASATQGTHPLVIRMMPDYGSDCFWTVDGLNTGLAYEFENTPAFEALEAIEERITNEWHSMFGEGDLNAKEEGVFQMDWQAFHALGEQIAIDIKSLLGDAITLLYEKPYEDPDHDKEGLKLIV